MKRFKFIFIAFVCLTAIIVFIFPADQKSLSNIYQKGKIRLIAELTLDDNSMPEDVYFEAPVDLTFDTENNIFVCDYKSHNIKVFDISGKFIKTMGRKGQGPGEFQMPFYLAFAKGRLVVWELRNRRLSVLMSDGEFVKSIQMPSAEGWPRKILPLPNGDFVIERVKSFFGDNEKPQECNIEIFSPNLEYKKTIYNQEFWENKYITSPSLTNVPQPFAAKVYWDVSPDGKIIVGYSEKYTIEIFDSEKGRLSSFNHTYDPTKVTKNDREKWFAGMTTTTPNGIKLGAPDHIVKNTKFPKYKPAFRYILVDGEGNILIFGHQKKSFEDIRYFDAFDPKGNFISNVQVVGDVFFPSHLSGVYIRGRFFWFRKTDEDGLFKIFKYRIAE